MKQKKVHTFNILIVTINTDGCQYGEFTYIKDISMYTHGLVINCNKNSDFGYTLIVDVDYPGYFEQLRKDLSQKNA